MNDALDEILEDSDDESEEQAVIDKVLDEIGIEISGKVIFLQLLSAKDPYYNINRVKINRSAKTYINPIFNFSWQMLRLHMQEL